MKNLKTFEGYSNDITLDDVYDLSTQEQKEYLDVILDNKGTIRGLYDDKWWKNGGWNGMMDAISDYVKTNNIKEVNLDYEELEEDFDIWDLIMKEF